MKENENQEKPQASINTSPNKSKDLEQISKRKQADLEKAKFFENKLMSYFGEEFAERKLEIGPKRTQAENFQLPEEFDKISQKAKLYRYLQDIESQIDSKIYKSRLDLQEKLIQPSNKVKVLLRTHIYSYIETTNTNGKENIKFNLRIQGKVKPLTTQNKNQNLQSNHSLPKGLYHKFTYYFQKIKIKFSQDNINKYQDIEWPTNSYSLPNNVGIQSPSRNQSSPSQSINPSTSPNININTNNINIIPQSQQYDSTKLNTVHQKSQTEFDGFSVSRQLQEPSPTNISINFYLNNSPQEYKLSPELADILGTSQETRPRILYLIWQYIKLNSLQDSDNPTTIINNKPFKHLFNCEKMDIPTLTSKLVDHIKLPDPISIPFTISPSNTSYKENQLIKDIIISIEDPHFSDIYSLISSNDKETLLFPKHVTAYNNVYNTNYFIGDNVEHFLCQMNEYDKAMGNMFDLLNKHKYKYDFYMAYQKDPCRFINNFLVQQNSLSKITDESFALDSRIELTSSQYYKDYEDVLRGYIDAYLSKNNSVNMGNSGGGNTNSDGIGNNSLGVQK